MHRANRFARFAPEARADPVRQAPIAGYKRAIKAVLTLAEPCPARGVTQQELTRALDVSQANVSRIERDEDRYRSALRRYVEALGGRIEVSAVRPDERVVLVE